ncbi:transglutaminase family protein [Acidobacteriota bacterium]
MSLSASLLAAALLLSSGGALPESTPAKREILKGEAGSKVLIRGFEEALPVYKNDGFEQIITVRNGTYEIEIKCALDTLGCRDPFPLAPKNIPDEIKPWLDPSTRKKAKADPVKSLAERLTKNSRFACEAVSAVIAWVAANIEYTTEQDAPVQAAVVLDQRRAFCVGQSNLTTAMLRSVGIPCRIVRGLLLSREGGFFLHRWVEVYYPSRGWVFSDPGSSINYVDQLHVLLYDPASRQSRTGPNQNGISAKLLESYDNLVPEDAVGEGQMTIRERRGLPVQHHASVIGRFKGHNGNRCRVMLKGSDISFERSLDREGQFYFLGLSPGAYRLRVMCGDAVVARKRFSLTRGEVSHVHFHGSTGARTPGGQR